MLYSALIRPSLEYSSSLWSPYTENVQRRATKFILKYHKDKSFKERLIKLDLLPLEYYREISDLLFIFRPRNGLTFIILGDPGADKGARESLNGRKNIYGTKKSKERREEPLETMSYQTSSKRSPPFWLLIGARKLVFFGYLLGTPDTA